MKLSAPLLNRRLSSYLLLLTFCAWSCARAAEDAAASKIKVERHSDYLLLQARPSLERPWFTLAHYVLNPQLRPYFHPLRDPSGRVVLTEDKPADHPWQHGIFTGFHRVNGFNYWKEDEGRQRLVRLENITNSAGSVSWRAIVEFIDPMGRSPLLEEDHITIHAPVSPDLLLIDFNLLLRAKQERVNFGKFFVGGLAVRMPWDAKNPRHTHLNSEGLRGRDCEQKRAAWLNVERPFGEDIYGIAMLDHPSNSNHPPMWRADEQGLINPNVSGLGDWALDPKQSRSFRYRLLVYRGSKTREALTKAFAEFSQP